MKKIFSIIAIAVTLVYVVYMVGINNKTEIKNAANNRKEEIVNKNKVPNKEKTKKADNVIKNKKEDNIKRNESKKIDKQESKKNNEDTQKYNVKKQDEDTEEANAQEKNDKKNMPVFKVDKNTIVSRVSFEDKAKLLIYSRKLSTTDEAQIKELMKSSDELNSSIKIFKILKLRLGTEDYNSVKSILSPYIDINLIEKNLK